MLGTAAYVGFVPVGDITRARDFYVGILGLSVVEESPFALVVDANGTMLRLTPVGEFTPQPFTIAGWDVDDIAAAVDALVAKGVLFNRYDGLEQDERAIWTSPSGALVAWFGDPAGNTLSLTEYLAS